MKTEIFASYEEFLKREDKTVNGVSSLFAKYDPDYEESNNTNEGCWECIGCSYCVNCAFCVFCSKCSDCTYSKYADREDGLKK